MTRKKDAPAYHMGVSCPSCHAFVPGLYTHAEHQRILIAHFRESHKHKGRFRGYPGDEY